MLKVIWRIMYDKFAAVSRIDNGGWWGKIMGFVTRL